MTEGPQRPPTKWLMCCCFVAAAALWTVTSRSSPATAEVPARRAGEVFRADCAVCHGADARGIDRGPTLVGVGRASVDYQLTTGRMPLAPAGRGDEPGRPLTPLPRLLSEPDAVPSRHDPAYDDATITALVDYVARLTGGRGPDIPTVGDGDVARGGELFRLQCASCHAWAGDGGALFHREAPSLHAATRVQIAEALRVGPGQMPAFAPGALTDRQVDDVVAYVRYLDAPRDRGGLALGHLGPVAEGAMALAAVAALLFFVRWIGDRG